MSVEFVPKKEECFCFEAPNGHLFALLREPSFSEILGDPPRTNDSIDASDEPVSYTHLTLPTIYSV